MFLEILVPAAEAVGHRGTVPPGEKFKFRQKKTGKGGIMTLEIALMMAASTEGGCGPCAGSGIAKTEKFASEVEGKVRHLPHIIGVRRNWRCFTEYGNIEIFVWIINTDITRSMDKEETEKIIEMVEKILEDYADSKNYFIKGIWGNTTREDLCNMRRVLSSRLYRRHGDPLTHGIF